LKPDPDLTICLLRGMPEIEGRLARRDALVGKNVQTGSFDGVCVWHEVVTVVVETVLVNSRAVRVRMTVDVDQTVIEAGVVVTVLVEIEDGRVIVEGLIVVEIVLVMVEVIVVDGVTVIFQVAVGVFQAVTGGAAMIENDL
jgi:hypothetical protein